jgi:hypothetical protein
VRRLRLAEPSHAAAVSDALCRRCRSALSFPPSVPRDLPHPRVRSTSASARTVRAVRRLEHPAPSTQNAFESLHPVLRRAAAPPILFGPASQPAPISRTSADPPRQGDQVIGCPYSSPSRARKRASVRLEKMPVHSLCNQRVVNEHPPDHLAVGRWACAVPTVSCCSPPPDPALGQVLRPLAASTAPIRRCRLVDPK